MKKQATISSLSLVILCVLRFTIGCAALTSKPPSGLETKLFDIKTNYVPVVALQTNIVTQTNQVFQTNLITGTVTQTNVVTVTPQIMTITNVVTAYDFTPKAAVVQDVQTIGGVTNTLLPGWGTLASTALTGILGLWATLRTRKQNAIAANLTQVIETARSVIKSLPNGATIGKQFDDFLVQHQTDANLLNAIGPLVDKYVNADQAQGAATKIIQLITTPLNTPPPVAAAPSNG